VERWGHTEQAEVAAVGAPLDKNACCEARGIFGDKELALCHVGADTDGVDTVAFDIGPLDSESSVDQADESVRVRCGRHSPTHAILSRRSLGSLLPAR